MAESAGVSGIAIASIFAGSILAVSGVKGWKVSLVTQDIISGKDPRSDPRIEQTALTVTAGGLVTDLFSGLNPFSILTGSPTSTGGSGSIPGSGSIGGGNAQNRALGKRMAAAVGWTGAQWEALDKLITAESGWSSTIMNLQGSGAAGIAQNIRGFGPGYQKGNAGQQIAWLINYIKARYHGSPIEAYNFWLSQSPHWY